MATLAAYDVQAMCRPASLHVYAYGCPRTGNHAFAHDYNARVPNTWQIMTDRGCPGLLCPRLILSCRRAKQAAS
jgi:predicted lipase